jgi:outer membrane exchange protein TraA
LKEKRSGDAVAVGCLLVSIVRKIAALVAVVVGLAGTAQAAEVFVTGDPVAPSPGQVGSGLCQSARVSTSPAVDFPQSTATFSGGVNSFLETPPDAANPNSRVTAVLRKPFDLSNNNTSGLRLSYGDFVNAVVGCQSGGCDFLINDMVASYASRLRGYLNVTPSMVGVPLHFGFYADDAVYFVIYDRSSRPYTVINRPPVLGAPTWRTTNSVTFLRSGLYPVEVLYTEITEHAALEMSLFAGSFTDFERPANQAPVVNLRDAGFTLLTPVSFFQTESGRPSYESNLDRCQQCNRQFANTAGNNECEPGYYCNGAALCAPCDSAIFCGPSCSPCGASTPLCLNVNSVYTCVQCSEDSQCPNGRCDMATHECRGCNDDNDCPTTGRCDLSTNECRGCNDDGDCRGQGMVCDLSRNECVQCNEDDDCPQGQHCATAIHECRECTEDTHCARGESCVDNECRPCSTKESCAGTSCNCCPGNLQCASLSEGATPTCVECTRDADCAEGRRCDTANGRCVEKLSECNTSERCGPQCVRCPDDRPYCLDGEVCVQCRSDTECEDGKYCVSGQCSPCTTDKRCGKRCEACADEAPFCLTDGSAAGSSCVGCREDADCGPGGACDPTTHKCGATACAVSCAEGTVCYGSACVECFADAHCPCGGTCDTASNTCSVSCTDSADCLGVEHCSASTQQCERGRRKPGTEPAGGAFCCGAAPETNSSRTAAALLLLLVASSLLLLRPSRNR